MSIHVSTSEPGGSLDLSFASLPLRDELLKNIISLGYETMTPIQAHSLPKMLEGSDLIGEAKTGSGKTAAFGLVLLHRLRLEDFSVQALVICPTRELAEQVTQVLRQLARLLPNVKILNISGGMSFKPQCDSLKHGAHIVVGTPGRIQKHLEHKTLSLSKLQTLVLDEADRMLDMGFIDEIRSVISFCPNKRQTLLFSATYPKEIKQLAHDFMTDPAHVIVTDDSIEMDIEQQFYEVAHASEKYALLIDLLTHHQPVSTLVFCNTKEQTTQLASQLRHDGVSAIALNGDMEQVDRDEAMILFVHQSCSILVATDVAARGLDIKALPCVINYDLAFERDVHVHRIGRTGRAGSKGLAVSITTPGDGLRLCAIETDSGTPLVWHHASELQPHARMPSPTMMTLRLNVGRKDKMRPGDILGALTKDAQLPADSIGKIDILAGHAYVAIRVAEAHYAYRYFQKGTLKGRRVSVTKVMNP